ncbi:MAG: PilN domain-containing protein [bacterium]|nr:PilN domain-containing protein [bacterium]
MIRINLLPEEQRKIERVRRVKINIAVIGGVAVVAVLIVIGIVLFFLGRRMRQFAEEQRRLEALRPLVEESESLLRKKTQAQKEMAVYDRIAAERVLWHRRLNDIGDAIPEDLFLVKMSFSARPPAVLVIQGEAMQERGIERVVEFIDALRGIPAFLDTFPRIEYSIESAPGGRRSFEIRCRRPAAQAGG